MLFASSVRTIVSSAKSPSRMCSFSTVMSEFNPSRLSHSKYKKTYFSGHCQFVFVVALRVKVKMVFVPLSIAKQSNSIVRTFWYILIFVRPQLITIFEVEQGPKALKKTKHQQLFTAKTTWKKGMVKINRYNEVIYYLCFITGRKEKCMNEMKLPPRLLLCDSLFVGWGHRRRKLSAVHHCACREIEYHIMPLHITIMQCISRGKVEDVGETNQ